MARFFIFRIDRAEGQRPSYFREGELPSKEAAISYNEGNVQDRDQPERIALETDASGFLPGGEE